MLRLPSFRKPESGRRTEKVKPPAELRCPLCGLRFRAGDAKCGSCPLAARCNMVMCPNCNYEFPA
jgi:hypothetical protein